MKELNVGLFGAVVNSDNLGCLALTYSLVAILESIAQENGFIFQYTFFEGIEEFGGLQKLSDELKIERNRISKVAVTYIYKNKTIIRHPIKANAVVKAIKKCDFCIDLTAGDSFTDIYGDERFLSTSRVKRFLEKSGIPLILGPQTYGPFLRDKNQRIAKELIENAACVIARDQLSTDYVHSFSACGVTTTTDLAFALPFVRMSRNPGDKIRIGINISSLLVSAKTENTVVNFKLRTDYDRFIERVLAYLDASGRYEVYLIPHVGKDGADMFASQYPDAHIVEPFSTPIQAKSFIANMDIFVGARMHATIGAFSAGVATIPTAYSRKFKGVYEGLLYPYVIDLENMETEEAVQKTIAYIEEYKALQKQREEVSAPILQTKISRTRATLSDCICQILEK